MHADMHAPNCDPSNMVLCTVYTAPVQPMLTCVHPMEPNVVRLRKQLETTLQTAIEPLKQYLDLYTK